MRVALLQANFMAGDIVGNAALIADSVRDAFVQGAQLCITPELALCGYPPRDMLLREDCIRACRAQLEELALLLAGCCPVLVGAPAIHTDGSDHLVYNAAILLSEGAVRMVGAKVLLPAHDMADDPRYFIPGTQCGQIDVAGCRLGVIVGEDIWSNTDRLGEVTTSTYPLVSELKAQDVNILVNMAALPFVVGRQRLHEGMLCAVAQSARLPVVHVNHVGGSGELVFFGNSMVVEKDGTLSAKIAGFEPQTLLVDVGVAKEQVVSHTLPQEEELWQALVLGTRDYVHKCGFQGAILGLSGGIDSALVACIAAEALGPEHVLGVLMPSPYSSQGSIDDAELLAEHLGIVRQTISIAPLMEAFDQALQPFFAGFAPDVAEENIQARIRGNLLMAMSNKFGKMLLTTGNKSELAVGYCTMYGDMAGGLGVISDVSKTMVYALCRWLNAHHGFQVVPQAILDKAPSAELRPGQTDADSLPDYAVLDDILERYIVHNEGVTRIAAAGHALELVHRVVGMVHRAEFKRYQAPPGLKVTAKAFGSGRRMPVVARAVL